MELVFFWAFCFACLLLLCLEIRLVVSLIILVQLISCRKKGLFSKANSQIKRIIDQGLGGKIFVKFLQLILVKGLTGNGCFL